MRLIPNPLYIAKNQTASSAPAPVEVFIQPLSAHSSITEDKVWCPVPVVSSITGTAQRRSARVTSSLLSLKSLFPRLRATPFPNGLSQLSGWPVQRLSHPEFHVALTTPEVSVRRGRSSVVFRRSPNSFISFYLRDIPAAEPSFSRAALAAAAQSQ